MPSTIGLPFLALFLLSCTLHDHCSRRVSNWLTLPNFCAAWPLALWLGAAAVSPAALGMGVLLLVLAFLGIRLYKGEAAPLPAAVGFYGGAIAAFLLTTWMP